MKVIGVLSRNTFTNDNKLVNYINKNIKNIIYKYNSIPYLICPDKFNKLNKKKIKEILKLCDGLIIPGGNKINKIDKKIIKYAIKKDIPIIGICLGMQILGSIDKKNNIIKNKNINHKSNKKYVHEINIKKDTILYNIFKKDKIKVNSRHNYHIKNTKNFIISSISNDNIIESIELKNKKFIIGVQWHPEDMYYYDKNAKLLFDYFFSMV